MAQAHLEEAPFNEGSPFETAELSSDEPLGPPTPAQFRNFTAEEVFHYKIENTMEFFFLILGGLENKRAFYNIP